jgi:hypothetical protein
MFLKRSTYEASLADVTVGLADVTGTDSMSVTPTLSCTPRRSVDGLTTGSTVPRVTGVTRWRLEASGGRHGATRTQHCNLPQWMKKATTYRILIFWLVQAVREVLTLRVERARHQHAT